jgi:predicted RNA methylase
MNLVEETLTKCTVDGLVVRIPDVQLERTIYEQVAQKLELIGGKWKGGKIGGFVFKEDPSKNLQLIANGETVNLKQQFQFFETPADLADELVKLAKIKDDHSVLEPQAGQGAIVAAINRALPNKIIDCYELMELNRSILRNMPAANIVGDDFLLANESVKYDRIVANPPFSKQQDIDHVRKMYSILSDGGRMISVASPSWQYQNNKKAKLFREWIESVGAKVIDLPIGLFKESGTTIKTLVIVIGKNSSIKDVPIRLEIFDEPPKINENLSPEYEDPLVLLESIEENMLEFHKHMRNLVSELRGMRKESHRLDSVIESNLKAMGFTDDSTDTVPTIPTPCKTRSKSGNKESSSATQLSLF